MRMCLINVENTHKLDIKGLKRLRKEKKLYLTMFIATNLPIEATGSNPLSWSVYADFKKNLGKKKILLFGSCFI